MHAPCIKFRYWHNVINKLIIQHKQYAFELHYGNIIITHRNLTLRPPGISFSATSQTRGIMFLTANFTLRQVKPDNAFSFLMAFKQSSWPGVFPSLIKLLNCRSKDAFSIAVHVWRWTLACPWASGFAWGGHDDLSVLSFLLLHGTAIQYTMLITSR